jgi:hypothetical protein
MQAIQGVTQTMPDNTSCSNPFNLPGKSSCVLNLQVNGSQISSTIQGGPVICQQGSLLQCYQPSAVNLLHITSSPIEGDAVITVTGSPFSVAPNGMGQLTINNISTEFSATNITSNFTGTSLDGLVTETGNTCALVNPGASCTLTYTAGPAESIGINPIDFTIEGTNTNALTAAMRIQSVLVAIVSPLPQRGFIYSTQQVAGGWPAEPFPPGPPDWGFDGSGLNFNNAGENISAEVVFVEDGTAGMNDGHPRSQEGCSPLTNGAAVNGKIALIYRGTCSFGTKILNAQNAGAIGSILIDSTTGTLPTMTAGVDGPNVTIPGAMVSNSDGASIAALLGVGSVTMLMGNVT